MQWAMFKCTFATKVSVIEHNSKVFYMWRFWCIARSPSTIGPCVAKCLTAIILQCIIFCFIVLLLLFLSLAWFWLYLSLAVSVLEFGFFFFISLFAALFEFSFSVANLWLFWPGNSC